MQKTTIDDRDWSALTLGERIRHVELEGYLVIPDLLSPEHIARLKAQPKLGRPRRATTVRTSAASLRSSLKEGL